MSKKLKLTKIQLETKDGVQISLSLDEAKDLHDQLHELFGTKYAPNIPIYIDRYIPTYNPLRPYWDTQPYCSNGSITDDSDSVMYRNASGLSVGFVGEAADGAA